METEKPALRGAAPQSELEPTERLLDFHNQLPPDKYRRTSGIVIGAQSKYVSWQIPAEEFSSIEILDIADVQFGHVFCKYERVIEFRDWIKAKPNRFMVWGGDMIDAGSKMSVGLPLEQLLDPQGQVFKFCEMWAPVRDRILGYVGGNHEWRPTPMFGDLGVIIASLLKIPYSDGRQLIDVHFGEHKPFKISLWHGRGNPRTMGAIAQSLSRYASDGDSQFYVMGHFHQSMMIPFYKEQRDTRARTTKLQKVVAALGSSFLEYWGNYGERAGFRACDVLMPRAVLTPDGKWEAMIR